MSEKLYSLHSKHFIYLTFTASFASPISLTFMSLDFGRKLEYLEKTHIRYWSWSNMQTPHTTRSFFCYEVRVLNTGPLYFWSCVCVEESSDICSLCACIWSYLLCCLAVSLLPITLLPNRPESYATLVQELSTKQQHIYKVAHNILIEDIVCSAGILMSSVIL